MAKSGDEKVILEDEIVQSLVENSLVDIDCVEINFEEAAGGNLLSTTACDCSRCEKRNSAFIDNFGYFFYTIAGEDEVLNAFELQIVMGMIFKQDFPHYEDFSLEACRSMLASLDDNYDGNLNYTQFKELWFKIMRWKTIFEDSDSNENRKIDFNELKGAFDKLDVELEENTIVVLMNRFSNKEQLINLDDFIQICCKITSAKKNFENLEPNVSLGKFLFDILYL